MEPPPIANVSLAEHIQSLAQELQDMIFDFTTVSSFPPGKVITLHRQDGKVKFPRVPAGLQVDRRSRAKAAEMYYSNNVFDCTALAGLFFVSWLRTLPRAHTMLIRNIHVEIKKDSSTHFDRSVRSRNSWSYATVRIYNKDVKSAGLELQSCAVKALGFMGATRTEAERAEWLDETDLMKLERW